ncbi:MAG: MIP/aquaporin family protein [Planctomycetota bacterium]|nr:MIP/aquaporin family protein [Planctomycetota bacterium]
MKAALLSEFTGTAGLLAGVVGSGIMAEQLSPGDVGLQLLQNACATAGVLVALILALQKSSGAHFNPAVTLAARMSGELTTRAAVLYVAAQLAGAVAGTVIANLMFDLAPVELSTKDRSGAHLLLAEFVATLGLVAVIHGVVRSGRAHLAAYAVGAYIAGAYYFTASTSFANPAVTMARSLTDTFSGIQPSSVLPFIAVQILGAAAAVPLMRAIHPTRADDDEH